MQTECHPDNSIVAHLLPLESVNREIDDQQAAILRLELNISKSLTKAAFQEFPFLKDMSASQIREVGQTITRLTGDFAGYIANLARKADSE